jgi:hypothetical protein
MPLDRIGISFSECSAPLEPGKEGGDRVLGQPQAAGSLESVQVESGPVLGMDQVDGQSQVKRGQTQGGGAVITLIWSGESLPSSAGGSPSQWLAPGNSTGVFAGQQVGKVARRRQVSALQIPVGKDF